ncbi:hypothetical protein R80B4_02426 [Fibrobacteres bacterium R8-0-B4]
MSFSGSRVVSPAALGNASVISLPLTVDLNIATMAICGLFPFIVYDATSPPDASAPAQPTNLKSMLDGIALRITSSPAAKFVLSE